MGILEKQYAKQIWHNIKVALNNPKEAEWIIEKELEEYKEVRTRKRR